MSGNTLSNIDLEPFSSLQEGRGAQAGESKAGSTVGLDNHRYIIWNVACIPGWELV
jgi:hypothetical protein